MNYSIKINLSLSIPSSDQGGLKGLHTYRSHFHIRHGFWICDFEHWSFPKFGVFLWEIDRSSEPSVRKENRELSIPRDHKNKNKPIPAVLWLCCVLCTKRDLKARSTNISISILHNITHLSPVIGITTSHLYSSKQCLLVSHIHPLMDCSIENFAVTCFYRFHSGILDPSPSTRFHIKLIQSPAHLLHYPRPLPTWSPPFQLYHSAPCIL